MCQADTQLIEVQYANTHINSNTKMLSGTGNTDFAALLNAAEARKTIQLYVELPNKRTATMLLALSGWQMNEIAAPANEVIQITVQGKQNKITWGTVAVSGGA